MNSINKLHYITQEVPGKTHWQLAEEACQGGVRWVQLRVKNKSYEELLEIALKTQAICRKFDSILIINDNVDIAIACKADGVHLGKTDIDPTDARKMLGNKMIIGGTANTFDDIKKLAEKEVDYIGLGPYRFTTTKEKLSPVLGIEGYKEIMKQCAIEKIKIPVMAIGGILREDVAVLLEAGINGVAVAAAIGLSQNITHAASVFVELLKKNNHELTNSR